MSTATSIIEQYYSAFHRQDYEAMLALLDENVIHEINQGGREIGIHAFRTFLHRMEKCYLERLEDIVIFSYAEDTRAAAEFIVHGNYLIADEGMPPAHGQSYVLPAGAFFELAQRKITRVTVYYNLTLWLQLVATNQNGGS